MTGEKINSLVGDLVAMARAMERQPELEAVINEQGKQIDTLRLANNALEDSNNILRTHIDELNAKIGEVTRERDDASFRVLEVEDKAAQALDLCKTLQTGLGQVIAKLEPPKPVEVEAVAIGPVVGEALRDQPEGQSEADPIVKDITGGTEPVNASSQTAVGIEDVSSFSPSNTVPGPSDPLPTSIHESTNGEIGQQADMSSGQQPKPYVGKRYMEVPGWISLSDWLMGGGTEANYHWRAN